MTAYFFTITIALFCGIHLFFKKKSQKFCNQTLLLKVFIRYVSPDQPSVLCLKAVFPQDTL